jgi:hypothetical protein
MGNKETPIDAQTATWMLWALLRDSAVQVRQNGGNIPNYGRDAMQWLASIAGMPAPAMSANGPPIATLAIARVGLRPVSAAAEIAGCSERHVRRLASAGQIRCERIGRRTLLVDVESLQAILKRSPHDR